MEQLINSRLITWPSTVEKSSSHTVVVIDATSSEIEDIANFFRTSHLNFDVYLYEGPQGDLQYLNHISANSDCVLISDRSQVILSNVDYKSYGNNSDIPHLLNYFKQIEQSEVDKLKSIIL